VAEDSRSDMTLTAKAEYWSKRPRDHEITEQYHSDMTGKVKMMRLPPQARDRAEDVVTEMDSTTEIIPKDK
jgi:hypothetical protein